MKRLYTILALVIGLCIPASAQYLVTLKDFTRLTVDDTSLSFANVESATDGAIVVGDRSIPLSDVLSLEPSDPEVENPIVLAYHPYYSSKLPKPEIITHINYSFAEVYVKNGVYTGFKLQGGTSAFNKTMKLKESHPDLKILLSFTHTVVNADNKQDGGFSAIAASDEYRKQFAQDCLDYCKKNGLDGIDLDWEFPGISWSGAACDPVNDVANYTLLLKQMRETLGDDYLLTFAGYCMDKRTTSTGVRYIDLAAAEPYVDYVNIMCYDFDEAPRYQNAIKHSASYWDIDRTITAYRKAGFPLSKVTIGIPFYARNNFGSGGSIPFYKMGTYTEANGYVTDNYDEAAGVPYMTKDGVKYGSYDNPRSIEGKARYAAEKGVRGLFYWCTYEDDTSYTLSRSVWDNAMLYMR